jgi:hypothetical protein
MSLQTTTGRPSVLSDRKTMMERRLWPLKIRSESKSEIQTETLLNKILETTSRKRPEPAHISPGPRRRAQPPPSPQGERGAAPDHATGTQPRTGEPSLCPRGHRSWPALLPLELLPSRSAPAANCEHRNARAEAKRPSYGPTLSPKGHRYFRVGHRWGRSPPHISPRLCRCAQPSPFASRSAGAAEAEVAATIVRTGDVLDGHGDQKNPWGP